MPAVVACHCIGMPASNPKRVRAALNAQCGPTPAPTNLQGEDIATTQNFVKDTVAPQGALLQAEYRWGACAAVHQSLCRLADADAAGRLPSHNLAPTPLPPAIPSPAAVEFTSTSPAATTTDAEAVFAFSGDDATGVNFTCTLTARWVALLLGGWWLGRVGAGVAIDLLQLRPALADTACRWLRWSGGYLLHPA